MHLKFNFKYVAYFALLVVVIFVCFYFYISQQSRNVGVTIALPPPACSFTHKFVLPCNSRAAVPADHGATIIRCCSAAMVTSAKIVDRR